MHMVIRAVVFATGRMEALAVAKKVFNYLVEERAFDRYTTFETDGTQMSGAGRWGKMRYAARVSSPEGKKMLNEGFRNTKKAFAKNITRIRKHINKPIPDLLEGKADDMFKHYLYLAGQYKGDSIWLYDHDGEGIRDTTHLNNVLKRWNSPVYADKEVWIVPADVHY